MKSLNKKLLILLSTLFISSAYAGTTHVVNCLNLEASDRAAIQNAINNADGGDTIYIQGTCQLDGTAIFISKSDLTITGAGKDGNWSSVIKGLEDSGGLPIDDRNYILNQGIEYNHGFEIGDGSSNAQIKNVVIKNLKFLALHHAIDIRPELNNKSSCGLVMVGDGYSSKVTVDKNWFDNNYRAIQASGKNDHLDVTNNLITNIASIVGDTTSLEPDLGDGINLQGHCRTCLNNSNEFVDIPVLLGAIANSTVSGNKISAGPLGGRWIRLIGMEQSEVKNNTMTSDANTTTFMYVSSSENLQVTNNILEGGGEGSFGYVAQDLFTPFIPNYPSASTNILVSNNSINNTNVGIAVASNTSNHRFLNIKITGSSLFDIYLCGDPVSDPICQINNEVGPNATFNNYILTTLGTVVVDNGTNNRITYSKK